MVTIFNRKELILTSSMDTRAKVKAVLSDNLIEYTIKTKNLLANRGVSRGRTGTAFINLDAAYEYKVYVRKEDYERAVMLIRNF